MAREYRQSVYQPPKGAVDLFLIRHGESQAAIPGQSFPMKDGHGDPALHPNGEAQAVAVGHRMKSEPLDAIYVTTLVRTHQTAAPLAAHLGMTPSVEVTCVRYPWAIGTVGFTGSRRPRARPSLPVPKPIRNGVRSRELRPRRSCTRGCGQG